MTQQQTVFLDLLRAALRGTCAESVPDTDTLCGALEIAAQHGLLAVVAEAVPEAHNPEPENEKIAAYRKYAVGQAIGMSERTLDFRALYRHLRRNGLHPVVFKGVLCSRLYPMEFHRTSGDNDLLLPTEELPEVRRLLAEYGLQMSSGDPDNYEVAYKDEDGRFHVEIHRSLFDDRAVPADGMNDLFGDIFPQVTETDGWLSMPPHEHMLFLLLHACKHFVGYGVGLRQTCDVALWGQAYADRIDWEKLLVQCESVRAAKFAAALFRIGEQYLGISLPLPDSWRAIDADPEALLADILSGGVFGFRHNIPTISNILTKSAITWNNGRRIPNLWKTLFPPCKVMAIRYPYLRRCPILLPVAWLTRFLRYPFKWRHSKNSIGQSKARLKLLRQYGIVQ